MNNQQNGLNIYYFYGIECEKMLHNPIIFARVDVQCGVWCCELVRLGFESLITVGA